MTALYQLWSSMTACSSRKWAGVAKKNALATGWGVGRIMRIAARLAMHAQQTGFDPSQSASSLVKYLHSYHGCDVIVRDISEKGFEAEIDATMPEGSVVRLRLPGAGVLLARVAEAQRGKFRAHFVNPVSPTRLRMTLGMANMREAPAAA